MASFPLPVEVRGECGEHYSASMLKLFPDGALVTFQPRQPSTSSNDSLPPLASIVLRNCVSYKYPLEDVRVAPTPPSNTSSHDSTIGNNGTTSDYHVGERVEVWYNSQIFASSETTPINHSSNTPETSTAQRMNGLAQQPMAWWPARVTKVTKELLGVSICNSNGSRQSSEIVDRSQVRPMNDRLHLTSQSLHTRVISLTPSMKFNLEEPGVVDLVRRLPGLVLVDLDEASHQLIFVSPDREVIRRVALLEETFLRFMQQRQSLTSQWGHRSEDRENAFTEVFSVDADLIGMAIGQQGHNIDEARKVPGVLSVFLDDSTKTFHVVGKTREAVKEAREKLEFMRDFIQVPDTYTSRIIGRNGQVLQEVVDKSQVIRVYVAGGLNEEGTDFVFPNGVVAPLQAGHFPFQVVGRRSQLEDARLLIEFHVDMLKQMDEQAATNPSAPAAHIRRGSGGNLSSVPRTSSVPPGTIDHRESSLPPTMNNGRGPRGNRTNRANMPPRGGVTQNYNTKPEDGQDADVNGHRSGYATDSALMKNSQSQSFRDEKGNRYSGRGGRPGRYQGGGGGRRPPFNNARSPGYEEEGTPELSNSEQRGRPSANLQESNEQKPKKLNGNSGFTDSSAVISKPPSNNRPVNRKQLSRGDGPVEQQQKEVEQNQST
jgi:hypothetical protein